MNNRIALYIALATTSSLISGCASFTAQRPSAPSARETRADERSFAAGTAIESQSIISVADKMAREILATPEIANARGTPRIVMLPIKNETRFPINKEVFMDRIVSRLNDKSAGRLRFVGQERVAE